MRFEGPYSCKQCGKRMWSLVEFVERLIPTLPRYHLTRAERERPIHLLKKIG